MAPRGSEHSRPVGRPAQAKDGRRGSYRPRCDRPPNNALDLIDRHLLRATESNELLSRYVTIIRLVMIVVLLGVLLCGAGAAAVVLAFGKSGQLAVGAGVAAGATVLVNAGFLGWRRWRRRT